MCNDLLNERSLNAILFVWLAVYLWLAVYSEISHCIWKGHSFQVNHRLEQNKQVANFACLYQMHLSANWTRKITRKTKQRTRKICNFPTDVISECSHNFDSLIGSITNQTEVNLLCFFFFFAPSLFEFIAHYRGGICNTVFLGFPCVRCSFVFKPSERYMRHKYRF